MARRKLYKFSENISRTNLIQQGKELYDQVKGNWGTLVFKNNQPIVLELGCGRGEYTLGLARLSPEQNFIGVDIKGERIWYGCKIADEEQLINVGFLRTQIQSLGDHFESSEVNEIWLTFPDPRPKKGDAKRRFTHPRFMEIYRRLLKAGGRLHLKTDNEDLFLYSLEVAKSMTGICHLAFTHDVYNSNTCSAPNWKLPPVMKLCFLKKDSLLNT